MADGREEMGVFVGVDVGDLNARALDPLDLGEGFAFDVFEPDDASEEGLEKVEQGGTEAFAVGSDEGWDCARGRDGNAVGEDDVATDAERGMGVGDGDGVIKCRTSRHEGGGGECIGLMKFGDGAIDA